MVPDRPVGPLFSPPLCFPCLFFSPVCAARCAVCASLLLWCSSVGEWVRQRQAEAAARRGTVARAGKTPHRRAGDASDAEHRTTSRLCSRKTKRRPPSGAGERVDLRSLGPLVRSRAVLLLALLFLPVLPLFPWPGWSAQWRRRTARRHTSTARHTTSSTHTAADPTPPGKSPHPPLTLRHRGVRLPCSVRSPAGPQSARRGRRGRRRRLTPAETSAHRIVSPYPCCFCLSCSLCAALSSPPLPCPLSPPLLSHRPCLCRCRPAAAAALLSHGNEAIGGTKSPDPDRTPPGKSPHPPLTLRHRGVRLPCSVRSPAGPQSARRGRRGRRRRLTPAETSAHRIVSPYPCCFCLSCSLCAALSSPPLPCPLSPPLLSHRPCLCRCRPAAAAALLSHGNEAIGGTKSPDPDRTPPGKSPHPPLTLRHRGVRLPCSVRSPAGPQSARRGRRGRRRRLTPAETSAHRIVSPYPCCFCLSCSLCAALSSPPLPCPLSPPLLSHRPCLCRCRPAAAAALLSHGNEAIGGTKSPDPDRTPPGKSPHPPLTLRHRGVRLPCSVRSPAGPQSARRGRRGRRRRLTPAETSAHRIVSPYPCCFCLSCSLCAALSSPPLPCPLSPPLLSHRPCLCRAAAAAASVSLCSRQDDRSPD